MGLLDLRVVVYDVLLFGIALRHLFTTGMRYIEERRSKKNPVAEVQWRKIGVVSELFAYPLEGGHRISMSFGLCTKNGIQIGPGLGVRDGCFVIYNLENMKYISHRRYPKIMNICMLPMQRNSFSMYAESEVDVSILLENLSNEEITIGMGGYQKLSVRDCGDEAGGWISKYILGKDDGLRLGYYNGERRREITDPTLLRYYEHKNRKNSMVETSSVKIINKASVEDFASGLAPGEIDVHIFRPNIVVTTDDNIPYTEFIWNNMKIGNVTFSNVSPCSSCGSVVFDYLTSLKEDRLQGYTIPDATIEHALRVLGVGMGLKYEGQIALNEAVYVKI